MKGIAVKFISFSIVSIILIMVVSSRRIDTKMGESLNNNQNGIAVLELFTSQGCSSCPPADKFLGSLATEENDHVIALAFHVDYWNRLGWVDSLSSSKNSDRQRMYASMIFNASVYTPQLVVNGTMEYVGSDEKKVWKAIDLARNEVPLISKKMINASIMGNKRSVKYELDETIQNYVLNVALLQKRVITNIQKGENRGLKLVNYNVVRDFVSTPITKMLSTSILEIPAGFEKNVFSIVLYAQEIVSGKITGATKSNL